MNYRIAEESPRDAERVGAQVLEELLRYNAGRAGPLKFARLVLSARGSDQALLGGLVAMQYWNAMHVDLLWVHELHRGRGIGNGLLRRAEESLRARGGDTVFLSTWSFQAPGFYEKLGYSQFAALDGVPPGGSRLWYRKRLL